MRGAMTEFNRIFNAVKVYKDSVNYSLRKYTDRARSVRRTAEDYKDEMAYIEKNLSPLKEEARKEITSARKDLNKVLETEREALERLLFEKIAAVPDKAFNDMLRFYRDFDLRPNRMEVSALLNASGGNTLAIKALNGFLEKAGAGYRVAATSSDVFAKDLDRITRLQRTFWTGTDYPAEAGEIFNGTPKPMYKDGKETDIGYKWDSVSRALDNAAFSEAVSELEKSSEAWAAEVLPKVVENENGRKVEAPHDLPQVEDVADSAEYFAKQAGAEKAAVDARAKETLDRYTRY